MKKETWIVVANSSIARIYKLENKNHLVELTVLEHPESRLHNRDLVSDKPGRDFESVGTARHSMEPRHTPKENEAMIFVRKIAKLLQDARNQEILEKIYLAANPSILGLLRQEIDKPTAQLIEKEISKDLTQIKPEEIGSHFPLSF